MYFTPSNFINYAFWKFGGQIAHCSNNLLTAAPFMGLSSAIGAPFLLNGVCLLPCGGSPPISVGFSPYFAIHFSSLVPPPPPSTSITFSVQPTINSQAFLARIKFAMVFSSLNRTSTNSFQIYGHAKQPPPEPPPPLEKILIYVKFPLMVFDKKLQRCLAEMNYVGRKDLIVFAANQFLFSIQQVVSSHVVRLIDFENPDSRYVHPQAKEMIRNWIELKTVVPQPTYHVWKIFAWLLGFCYWFCSVLLISKSLKFIDVKILVSLVNCVVFSRGGGSGGTQGGHSPP
ncbi:hypothetical protein QL285_005482 [Trifolium repens]|nr:hypothetical protein QL285_005482 [Trifolium repens]